MTDITNTNLEAAFLDQNVAGTFRDKRYAYIAVIDDEGWALGVAVQDEAGYNPITGKTFKDRAVANEWADSLNKHIGLQPDDVAQIVISSMRRRLVRQW